MDLFFAGLLLGILCTGLCLFIFLPGIMLKEGKSSYNFEQSQLRFEEAVINGGWKIPAKHDLRETLKKFGKSDVLEVMVFEICHPDLAEKILLTDDERVVSNLMPCRVAIYEKSDRKVYFSRMNSGLISKAMGKVTRRQMKIAFSETEKFLQVLISN